MDFKQAEDNFKQLKAQFTAGTLSEPEFKTQLEELMVQDEQGAWWMIGYETERWYRYDGKDWVQTNPAESLSQKPDTPIIPPKAENVNSANQNVPHGQAKDGSPGTKSVWIGLLLHFFLGAGLFYANSQSLRKWIYPLTIVFILIGFFDLDYALGGDIMHDSTAAAIAAMAFFIYAVGFIDTRSALRKRNSQSQLHPQINR